jgi:hypothetical protein
MSIALTPRSPSSTSVSSTSSDEEVSFPCVLDGKLRETFLNVFVDKGYIPRRANLKEYEVSLDTCATNSAKLSATIIKLGARAERQPIEKSILSKYEFRAMLKGRAI